MIYGSTESEIFSIEIRWERIPIQRKQNISADEASAIINEERSFVRSLIVPYLRQAGITGGDLPLLFVSCPGIFSIYCNLITIDWDVLRRSPKSGSIDSLTMKCTFKENPKYWYSQQEIAAIGYDRG
jgi:hypothetical protein